MAFDPKIPNNSLPLLPGDFDYMQSDILKAAIEANSALAKLNGLAILLPKAELLMSPMLTKESVESNAIENINTTTLRVLQAEALDKSLIKEGPEKEVLHYRKALLHGIEQVKHYGGIPTNLLIDLQHILEPNKQGLRSLPGTIIANSKGEVLYTPPEGEITIRNLLSNLEHFIHAEDGIDPLIKTAVVYFQFESIHPFYDGNGRTGRMLILLYLIMTGKLEYPVLFLSEYINKTRQQYYQKLNRTNHTNDYYDFIIYLLQGITIQATETQKKIISIKELMESIEFLIRDNTKFDYHHITTVLFSHPFIALADFGEKIGVIRQTASKYVSTLKEIGIIKTIKIGRNILIYIPQFIDLLS